MILGKETTIIFISMPSLFNGKVGGGGTTGNDSRATGRKPGLSWAPWKVLVGKLEAVWERRERQGYGETSWNKVTMKQPVNTHIRMEQTG